MASGPEGLSVTRTLSVAALRIERKPDSKRRKIRRCKSAPSAEFVIREIDEEDQSAPWARSFLRKMHIHPSMRKVAVCLLCYVTAGSICFSFLMNQIKGEKINRVLDSVYFTVVTMTTVGYGDLTPNSPATKLLASAFVFTGMILAAIALSKVADYLVEKQETIFIKALHARENLGPSDVLKEMEINKVRYKCLMMLGFLVVLTVVGTVFLAKVERLDTIDAFYCVCATITTLGYGDISFSTKGGRIFAIFWILTSTICLAQFMCYIAEFSTEKKQKALAKSIITRKLTNVDLEAADIDDDGSVSPAEFMIYKLKEMGKISQEDISLLLQEFEKLDVDQSGTLSSSDLALAECKQL